MKAITLTCLALLMTACASTNHSTMTTHHTMMEHHHTNAATHEKAGNYIKAKRLYMKEMHHARLGHPPAAGISSTYHNLGRIKGYLCEISKAEFFLLQSLQAKKKELEVESRAMAMYQLELAMFYYDQARYSSSAPYYASSIPMAIQYGMQEDDPIAVAQMVDEYATVLEKTNHPTQAIDARKQAQQLRANSPDKKAHFMPTRYQQDCVE